MNNNSLSTREPDPTSERFKHILQGEFVRRCKKNPNYSLRSFAKSLKLDSSTLSQFISGRRPITRKTAKRLAGQIELSPAECDVFAVKENEMQKMSADHFSIISDWYHFAILELMELKGFRPDIRWISKKLNLSATETRIAVERLCRVGLLKIHPDGRWEDISGGYTTTGEEELINSAYRRNQRQILEKSIQALEEIPIERRDHSAVTFSMRADRIPEAQNMIRDFRRKFATLLTKDSGKDSVYVLGIGFFPLTTSKEREN